MEERAKLEEAGVWDIAGVREWSSVKNDSEEAMVGRVFAIMGEKHAEQKKPEAERKYKARVVFAGNNVQTASGTAAHELYQEISSTPAAMATVRGALGIAALRGYKAKMRDAVQAFIQARIDGPGRPKTWIRLPKAWWPKSWFDDQGRPLYFDPVVPLCRALYGHPESGALWDKHLRGILRKLGWSKVESHPGLYIHDETKAVLVVYVDDLLMAAPTDAEERLWAEIAEHVQFSDPPEPISKFLGGHHSMTAQGGVTTSTCQMKEFLLDAVAKYQEEIGAKSLPPVRTPYLEEDFLPKGHDGPGLQAKSAASHLMKLLFAARLCRPDLLVAITRLASKVSCWQLCHDRALRRLFQYVAHHADYELVGQLSEKDLHSCVLVISPDADLAGDMETTKSTSGMFLELRSADGMRTWPLSWRSKKQGSTASSTCEAEYISLSSAMKLEGLPMQDLFATALGREMTVEAREDNTQCIAAVKNGYSAVLRHLPRTERIALSVCHELFIENEGTYVLKYEPSEEHRGDIFTKKLSPILFERAVNMACLRRMTKDDSQRTATGSD